MIFQKLGEVDLFVAILTKNFNQSPYCNQEVGIALYNDINIIPISIDGTKPEGFFDKIQSKKIDLNKKDLSINFIASSPEYMINNVLCVLKTRNGYDECGRLIDYLSNFFEIFKSYQINDFVMVSLNNNQISDARSCHNNLMKFYSLHKDKISQNLLEEFKKIL